MILMRRPWAMSMRAGRWEPAARGAQSPEVKTKCPDWKRINAERHTLFEDQRKPELLEAQKTRLERPGSSNACDHGR
jgi:hypothetical protein